MGAGLARLYLCRWRVPDTNGSGSFGGRSYLPLPSTSEDVNPQLGCHDRKRPPRFLKTAMISFASDSLTGPPRFALNGAGFQTVRQLQADDEGLFKKINVLGCLWDWTDGEENWGRMGQCTMQTQRIKAKREPRYHHYSPDLVGTQFLVQAGAADFQDACRPGFVASSLTDCLLDSCPLGTTDGGAGHAVQISFVDLEQGGSGHREQIH